MPDRKIQYHPVQKRFRLELVLLQKQEMGDGAALHGCFDGQGIDTPATQHGHFFAMCVETAHAQPRRLTLMWFQRNPLPVDWQAQRDIITNFE